LSLSSAGVNRQVVIANRPTGLVEESNFEMRSGEIPIPPEGKALVRILWLSLDPAQRTFLSEAPPWGPPLAIGDVMRGNTVAEVIDSRTTDLPVGSLVEGWFGWQDYAVISPRQLGAVGRVPAGVSPADALSVIGITGLTAYFGVIGVGRPQPGQTMVVSAAGGATGSIAGQVARLVGCRVIGIAGGASKCRWVKEVAGFDEAIDYRSEDVGERLRNLVPGGVELFFDNVGGDVLDAVLGHLAYNATIIVCGSVSSGYREDADLPPGPRNYVKLSGKSARMEGFTLVDFADQFGDGVAQLRAWRDAGELHQAHDVIEGLEHAPRGLRRLFDGENLGKGLIKVSDPSIASLSS
jgi:NADPH-dependent curcumin reductase CurA